MNRSVCNAVYRWMSNGRHRFYEISSEALALAVAEEWNMQKEVLNVSLMRLTSLIITAIDNPMSLKKSDLVSQVLDYLDKDTILYRLEENTKLLELQKKNWDPVIEWANWEYGLSVKPSQSLVEGYCLHFRNRCI
ncbi:unnamed protein product [Gongylonema pulchrum]|uniref:BACK domain-containing protein n=1 Tax=Gongylonema pulchrum TaxID=637853 RepID=A0A183EBS9_9BILA|nr:unnamed protein product [Gongylonema pulchrum]